MSYDFGQLAVIVAGGLAFGFALEKGQMSNPVIIKSQMGFHTFGMIKMFLAAVGSSQLSFALLQTLKPGLIASVNKKKDATVRGLASVMVGGAMVGVGMRMAGSCPGTVLPQIGTMVPNSLFTLAGGIAGSVAYSLIEPTLEQIGFFNLYVLKNQYLTDYFPKQSFQTIALTSATMMAGMIMLLEYLLPWKTDKGWDTTLTALSITTFPNIEAVAWPPYLAGLIIGALEIPLMLSLGDPLGASTSYSSFAARCISVVSPAVTECAPSLKSAKNSWQLFFVIAAIAGGFVSASASSTFPSRSPGLPALHAFLGGFISLLGSRIGNGCTSGHGISGMGVLRLRSAVAVASMFVGGFAASIFV